MINRLIFWLSLAGMILALHLWVQKARGFDQGCLGMGKPVRVAAGDCQEVSDLPASHLFGVSNAAWGYAFYFGLSLISFAKIIVRPQTARRLHRAGEAAVVLGAGYSGYLVYAMAAASAFCVLCLTSAALIATLLILHVLLRRRGGFEPVSEAERMGELGLAGIGAFAGAGVLVGVIMFVNRIGTRALDQGSSRAEFERLVGETLPNFIDGEKLFAMRACRFDRSHPALPLEKFIDDRTPFLGRREAVPVIVFLDPNCPHCQEYFPRYLQMAEKFKERARFTVLPHVIWDSSLDQVAALKLAEGTGKYFEVWRLMLERQPGPRNGMSVAQMAEIFRELGIDAANLEQRLAAVRPAVQAARRQAAASSVTGVPSVYIGSLRVWSQNRSEACIDVLLARVAATPAR